MALSVRPKVYSLPSYSLTGDLLGFLRCGLQYRYTRIGRLPSARPVQLWFGEFIHGVLEEAFRRYRDSSLAGNPNLPPWSTTELQDIRNLIKARLAARGLYAWGADLEQLGDERADASVQELGPHLFPLIHRAEVRLTGARLLPPIQPVLQFRVADRYEMVGVVDVVTHLELANPLWASNPIVAAIKAGLSTSLPSQFEVIIDYKGMRRPPKSTRGAAGNLWTQNEWQLQTYGELRRTQTDALPVVAGVLLYVNELHPTRGDLVKLKDEVSRGVTDVPPRPGSAAEKALRAWKVRDAHLPELPFEYRLSRALRVVPITTSSIATALTSFDAVVKEIETCRGREVHGTPVLGAWANYSTEEDTCAACDHKTYCPGYSANFAKGKKLAPELPGVKI